MGEARVGTSGWSYRHWRDIFYPPGLPQCRWLEHYAEEFDTVELNASFYRLPPEKTWSGWRDRTPDRFRFAVKAPRSITHRRKLADCAEQMDRFLSRVALLGDRAGPILVQLPPNWSCDLAVLRDFLALLPPQWRFAFEFRDRTWLCDEVYSLLAARGAAVVRVSAPRFPDAEADTAAFKYVRMHGEEKLYASEYSEESLAAWAETVAEWLQAGKAAFVYFNNDVEGHAVADARALRRLVTERCSASA
jgi:uncharacterized protein YecE (DUF72 family)